MIRWLLAVAVVGYAVFLFVAWSLCEVAARADDVDLFDLEPDVPGRPCPLCTSSNVYVDTDDVCFCITCRASYPLANATEPR